MSVFELIYAFGTTCSLLVLITAFIAAIYWLRKPRNLPPGPFGFPFVGYLPLLAIRAYRTGLDPHELLTQMSSEYGKIYSFDLMGITVVVISDYKILKEAMQNRHLNDREPSKLATRVFGITELKMSHFQPYRKFAISAFRTYGQGNATFSDMVTAEVAALSEQLKKADQTEPRALFQAATTNVIYTVASGKRYEYTDERFKHLLHVIDKWNDYLGTGMLELYLPVFKHIPTKAKQGLSDCADIIITFIEQIVSEHRQDYDADSLKDFIDAYLHEQRLHSKEDLSETSWLTDANLRGSLYSVFAAGGDATSSILCWCLAYLTHHPDVQDSIHREMNDVIGKDRLPTLSDRDKLPLTRAFILEVLRSSGIVPLAISHAAAESVVLAGYNIPKGSTVIPNIWAVLRDPDIWGDPGNFRPNRFLDDNGQIRERDELIVFNVGRRSCPGEALAKCMLFIFITQLLHQFSFTIPKGSPLPSLRANLGIILKPQPFQVECKPRF